MVASVMFELKIKLVDCNKKLRTIANWRKKPKQKEICSFFPIKNQNKVTGL